MTRVSGLIRSLGAEAVGNTREQFLAFVNAAIAKWATVIRSVDVEQDYRKTIREPSLNILPQF